MKKILSILFCLALVAFSCLPAYAVSISLVDTTKLPVISTKLSAEPGTYDNLDTSLVSATLDDQELINGVIEKEDSNVEWIFMIDTSKSVSDEYFKAEINAVLYVLNNLNADRGDKLIVYTFQDQIKTVLYGNESTDSAKQKINAIVCDGQDTEFYAAIKQLVDKAEKSTASVCVPVIFSDGVETLHPDQRSSTIETLNYANAPVYGYYPDVLNTVDGGKAKIASFEEIIKATGGVTKSYNINNASSQLESFNSDDTWSLTFTASREITAGDHTLTIDMGDGNKVEKVIKFDTTWEGDKEAPTITSIVSDKEENTITVMFSEVIKNWDDKSLYEITVSNDKDTAPVIKSIGRTADETVVLQLDTLDVSGVKITVKNYQDAAGNVGEEQTKSISVNQNLVNILSIAGGSVVAVIVVIIIILLTLSKRKKKKALIESGAVQAAYKKGKKIEPKPERKSAEKKVKEEKTKETPEEKAAREKAEKEKKIMEEKKRKEAEKFQFYFEQNYKDDDDD